MVMLVYSGEPGIGVETQKLHSTADDVDLSGGVNIDEVGNQDVAAGTG